RRRSDTGHGRTWPKACGPGRRGRRRGAQRRERPRLPQWFTVVETPHETTDLRLASDSRVVATEGTWWCEGISTGAGDSWPAPSCSRRERWRAAREAPCRSVTVRPSPRRTAARSRRYGNATG